MPACDEEPFLGALRRRVPPADPAFRHRSPYAASASILFPAACTEVLPCSAGETLALDRLTASQLIRHDLTRRVHDRLGVLEVQFLAHDADRLLPVLIGGDLLILRWGNRRGESVSLPCTLWTQLATVEAGGWAAANVEEVVIPAALALDSGIWVPVAGGVRGLVVADERDVRRVYPICEPASPYYSTMTKSAWMPCLAGQGGQGLKPSRASARAGYSASMSTDPRHKLLFGPYRPPSLRVGDVAICLVRNCDVIVTSWTDARISWPRCRSVERPVGGSGLLVDEELTRAVMNESEAPSRHWWGASVSTVRWWRRTLGVTRTNNPGTHRLITASAKRGAAYNREREYTAEERAARSKTARRLNLAHHTHRHAAENPGWSAVDLALLGTMPDDEVARLTGKSHNAVRLRREKLGIPNPTDRRRNRKARGKPLPSESSGKSQ